MVGGIAPLRMSAKRSFRPSLLSQSGVFFFGGMLVAVEKLGKAGRARERVQGRSSVVCVSTTVFQNRECEERAVRLLKPNKTAYNQYQALRAMAKNGFSVQAALTCPLKLLFAIRSLAHVWARLSNTTDSAIQIFVICLSKYV